MKDMMHFIITQKFRFDIAVSLMSYITFILVAITAAKTIQEYLLFFGIKISTFAIDIFIFLFSLFFIFFVGYALDKYFKYQQTMYDITNERNPQIMEILERVRNIDDKLEKK